MATDTMASSDRKKAVTSYDVAALAGVSQSAVSRCYKPGASVSKKMRAKVEQAAKELGYEPNALARSLITSRSNSVGVIISNLTNLYYPEVLAQLSRQFSEQGIRVLLFALESESEADRALSQIWQYKVDGVVCAAKLTKDQIAEFAGRDIPLLFYNRQAGSHAASAVCCDQAAGTEFMVEGLIRAGHRSFALLKGPRDSVVGAEREESARATLSKAGITDLIELDGDFSYEGARDAIRHMMDSKVATPDAVICANDVSAIGAIDTLRNEFDLEVPDQISVVGFDGVGPSSWASFGLTTIRQPVRRMTKAAVDMILERVETPELANEKRVFSGIFVRGSSARIIEG
ncbi:LacI family DNA-binding transcriptional regulator [Erythrobacter sp. MTPC3]|uniref:LacI family DNA-binding transcriptional regulator n=1 Tax=Erythrobacter sp. MTPC3 TaxID=3056564 RepID=UPI0036F2281F